MYWFHYLPCFRISSLTFNAHAMFTNDTLPDLTPAERQVLILVSQDCYCKEIAVRLSICTETVKKHRKNIAHKLGATGKADFRRAVRQLERDGHVPFTQ